MESCRMPKSEHARECMQIQGNDNPKCKVEVNMMQFQSPEKETDCDVVTENSVAVSKSKSCGNTSSQCHVCRFCSRVFSSGKALGGHVRIHGASRSNGQSSSGVNVSAACDYSSTAIWVKKSKVPTSRSNGNCNWVRADSIEEEGEEVEEEEEDYRVVKNMNMEELSDRKTMSLYTLRRNPKRSRRLTDEEFCLDLSAKNSRACVECGKAFHSSKALFGHMRCHPERDWRGIQPPNDNTNSTDNDDSQDNTTCGDLVVHVSAPSSGLSSVCWQSSHGSEDLEEHGEEEIAASDNESDRESTKAAHKPASCSLLNWSVTAKRGRRIPIRSPQPPQEDDADADDDEEEEEVENTKELEDDTDTAHFLVMLASSANNTNGTNKANIPVERKMTEESVHHSKTGKRESQGSFEDLEARQDDLGWKEKMKKSRTDKTSRPVDLVASLGETVDKYNCCTCKQQFNSHQALVGHRSSRKKFKGCFATTNINDEMEVMKEEEITEECSSVSMMEYHPDAVDAMDSKHAREEEEKIDNLSQELSSELLVVLKKGKGYECCICHKVFPSGQALGGHKRCHWTGEYRVTETTNSVISTGKQSKVLGDQARNVGEPLFDLNEPAPVDEEDLEGGYGMVEVANACTGSVNQRIKSLDEARTNGDFGYVV